MVQCYSDPSPPSTWCVNKGLKVIDIFDAFREGTFVSFFACKYLQTILFGLYIIRIRKKVAKTIFGCPYCSPLRYQNSSQLTKNRAANKCYSSAGHHEQENKKTTGQCTRPFFSGSTYRVYLGNYTLLHFQMNKVIHE